MPEKVARYGYDTVAFIMITNRTSICRSSVSSTNLRTHFVGNANGAVQVQIKIKSRNP